MTKNLKAGAVPGNWPSHTWSHLNVLLSWTNKKDTMQNIFNKRSWSSKAMVKPQNQNYSYQHKLPNLSKIIQNYKVPRWNSLKFHQIAPKIRGSTWLNWTASWSIRESRSLGNEPGDPLGEGEGELRVCWSFFFFWIFVLQDWGGFLDVKYVQCDFLYCLFLVAAWLLCFWGGWVAGKSGLLGFLEHTHIEIPTN